MMNGEWIGFLGLTVGGGFAYLSTRFQSRSTAKVDQARVDMENRKVDQAQYDDFKKELTEKVSHIEKRLNQTDSWLKISLRHILEIRRDFKAGRSLTPFPMELQQIPVWRFMEETDESPERTDS